MDKNKTILFLAPHLSTGGMPQFVLKRLESLIEVEEFDIKLIEINQYSDRFIIQREKIKKLLKDNFYSLGYVGSLTQRQRGEFLVEKIDQIKPDIIHIEECPETFDDFNKIPEDILEKIYKKDRSYKIVETPHNISVDNSRKKFHPDSYFFCTPYHFESFKSSSSWKKLIEYPIDPPENYDKNFYIGKLGLDKEKINILNVGLWTPGKNQKEGVEVAKRLQEKYPGRYKFYFIGNLAPNFKNYWEEVLENPPENVEILGERNDIGDWLKACDLFLFNSTHECLPISLKESISNGLITIARDLPQYKNTLSKYLNEFKTIDQLTEKIENFSINQNPIGVDTNNSTFNFKRNLIEGYNNLEFKDTSIFYNISIEDKTNFKLNCFDISDDIQCEFYDKDTLLYKDKLKTGHWYSPLTKNLPHLKVIVKKGNSTIYEYHQSYNQKKIDIVLNNDNIEEVLISLMYCESLKNNFSLSKLNIITNKNTDFIDKQYYRQKGIEFLQKPSEGDYKFSIDSFFKVKNKFNLTENYPRVIERKLI